MGYVDKVVGCVLYFLAAIRLEVNLILGFNCIGDMLVLIL